MSGEEARKRQRAIGAGLHAPLSANNPLHGSWSVGGGLDTDTLLAIIIGLLLFLVFRG